MPIKIDQLAPVRCVLVRDHLQEHASPTEAMVVVAKQLGWPGNRCAAGLPKPM